MKKRPLLNTKNVIGFVLIALLNARFLFQVILGVPLPLLEIVIYGILIFSVNYQKQTYAFVWLPVMTVLCLAFNHEAIRLLFIMLVCFAFYGIEIKKIALYNCICAFILFLIIQILLYVGILENEHVVYTTDIGLVRERNDMGIGLNRIGLFVSAFIMNLYILIAHLRKFWVAALLFSIAFVIFYYTNSQTSFVGEMTLILAFLIYESRWRKILFNKTVFIYLPLLFTVLSLGLGIAVDRFPILNLLTSNRLYFTNIYLHSAGISDLLVGNATFNSITIDNIYIRLLFEGGILFYLFFYYIYYKAIRNLFEKDGYLLPVIIGFLVTGLGETNFLGIAIIGNAVIWNVLYNNAFRKKEILLR